MVFVQIYGRDTCGYTVAAINLCTKHHIPFEYTPITDTKARELARIWHQTTLPFVFVDGHFIGGFTDLKALLNGGNSKCVVM